MGNTSAPSLHDTRQDKQELQTTQSSGFTASEQTWAFPQSLFQCGQGRGAAGQELHTSGMKILSGMKSGLSAPLFLLAVNGESLQNLGNLKKP